MRGLTSLLSTISVKLAAPFLLVLLPIGFLLYFLVRTHEQGIDTTRNELAGLPAIVAALDLAGTLVGSDALKARQEAAAQAEVALTRDRLRWPSHGHATEQLDHAIAFAHAMRRPESLPTSSIVDALDGLTELVKAVGDASSLILDPDLDSYYLMDMLVNGQMQLFSALARLHAEETFARSAMLAPEAAALRHLPYRQAVSDQLVQIRRNHAVLNRYLRDATSRTAIAASHERLFATLEVVEAEPNSIGAPVPDAAYADIIAATVVVRQLVHRELSRLLEARIARIEQVRNDQIIYSCALFVLALAAMMALIQLLVNRPVVALTRAMLDLAEGDTSIVLGGLDRADEIGAMSRAVLVFRENALRRRSLEERARADGEALALTAATLERAEHIGGMGHWRRDFRNRTTTWSPSLFELTGFDAAQGVPRVEDFIRNTEPADQASIRKIGAEALATDRPVEAMIRYRHPERGLRHFRLVVEAHRDAEGNALTVLAAVHDITAVKDNERKLEARSEALAEAQAMGRIGNWAYRFGDATVNWSPEVYHLLRLEAQRFQPRRADVLGRCQGDSARRLLAAESEVIRTRGIRAVDVTVLRGDGTLADFTITSKAELDEAGAVIGIFGTLQDISDRKNAERELEKLAFYDPLSGLANRALFQRFIGQSIAGSQSEEAPAALMMLDLDRFKEVNDSLGHQAGDELLVKVAERLQRALPMGAFLARLGGDEFAAIIERCGRQDAGAVAASVIAALAQPIFLRLGEVSVGTSVGIAMMPEDGTTADELMGHADLALYRAKESGRGRAEFFRSEFSEFAQDKIRLARDLGVALQSNEGLYLVYQPQVDLMSGAVCGFEALLRWRHPTRGNVPPSTFIPIAESSKLISELGLWVLREACRQIRLWRDAGQPLREVAINVSPAQLWHTEMEVHIAEALRESDIPPGLLCIEVTESVFVRDAEGRVRKALDAIRALGVQLALDDFGTGYSSLGYLNRFPFDKLKIDRSFIDGVDFNDDRLKLLTGIVSMSRALGKRTIAEGAERAGEVAVLASLGCDIVQGYVFSRPLPPDEAIAKAADIEAATLLPPAENAA